MHKLFFVGAAIAALELAACSNMGELQARSVSQWQTYCAAQHKQFLWKDTVQHDGLLMSSVQVEGRCVGPGEKGYRPPEPPDDSS